MQDLREDDRMRRGAPMPSTFVGAAANNLLAAGRRENLLFGRCVSHMIDLVVMDGQNLDHRQVVGHSASFLYREAYLSWLAR